MDRLGSQFHSGTGKRQLDNLFLTPRVPQTYGRTVQNLPGNLGALVPTQQDEVIVIKNLNIFISHKVLPSDFLHQIYKLYPLLKRKRHVRKPEDWPHNAQLSKGRV